MFNKEKITPIEHNYLGQRVTDGNGMFLVAFMLMYVANFAMLAFAEVTNLATDNLYLNYGVMFATQFMLFLAPILYAKMFNRQVIEPSRIKRTVSPTQAIVCVGVAVATMIACLPLANIVTDLFSMMGYNNVTNLPIAKAEMWWTLPLSLIFVAVLPAICEEFLFRGNIARAFKAKSYVFAMIRSSLLFAIFHGNPLQLIHQFFLGLAMSYAYFVTGSLLAPIIIHFTNNAISIVTIFVQDSMGVVPSTLSWGVKMAIYIPMIIVGAILVYISLRTLTRLSRKRAGLATEKASLANFFRDFGRAFYPQGISLNIKALNATMKELYNDPIDNIIPPTAEEEIGEMEDKKLRSQLIEAKKAMEKRRKRTDRTSLVIAIALATAIVIMNTLTVILKANGITGIMQ